MPTASRERPLANEIDVDLSFGLGRAMSDPKCPPHLLVAIVDEMKRRPDTAGRGGDLYEGMCSALSVDMRNGLQLLVASARLKIKNRGGRVYGMRFSTGQSS